MARKKPGKNQRASTSRAPAVRDPKSAGPARSSSRSTVSGPSAKGPRGSDDAATRKMADTGDLAASMPANPNKADEYGDAARNPKPGAHREPRDPATLGSTLSESNPSTKVGSGAPPVGFNPANGPLDRVRADSANRVLTTNQGVPVADNQNSLKAGLRGPALLEDFILREKITHFDHERIP